MSSPSLDWLLGRAMSSGAAGGVWTSSSSSVWTSGEAVAGFVLVLVVSIIVSVGGEERDEASDGREEEADREDGDIIVLLGDIYSIFLSLSLSEGSMGAGPIDVSWIRTRTRTG